MPVSKSRDPERIISISRRWIKIAFHFEWLSDCVLLSGSCLKCCDVIIVYNKIYIYIEWRKYRAKGEIYIKYVLSRLDYLEWLLSPLQNDLRTLLFSPLFENIFSLLRFEAPRYLLQNNPPE